MKLKAKSIRLIAMVLVLVAIVYNFPEAGAIEKDLTIEEIVEAQAQAVAANEALMQYFFDNGWVREYPEYFGGCYIKDNILNVRLVNPTEQTMEILSAIFTGYQDVVKYEYCQYSQKTLQQHADVTSMELKDDGYK